MNLLSIGNSSAVNVEEQCTNQHRIIVMDNTENIS